MMTHLRQVIQYIRFENSLAIQFIQSADAAARKKIQCYRCGLMTLISEVLTVWPSMLSIVYYANIFF